MSNIAINKPKKRELFLYIGPGFILYAFVVLLPVLFSLKFSFYEWSGGKNQIFIGLENYIELIKDNNFRWALKNNLIIIILCIIGQIGIAFLLATVMNSKLLKFNRLHRTIIFLPVVLSAVVIGFLWTIMYNRNAGLINLLFKSIGLSSLIKPWLDDPDIVLYSVSIPLIWQFIGLYLVIFLAAYQSIPKSIYEVAEIDGASGLAKMTKITFPLIMDTVKVALMLCIAGNMKVFDHIFVMTNGGPGNSSTVVAQYAYNNSFIMFKMGYGSAISIAIMIISLVLIIGSRQIGGKKNA